MGVECSVRRIDEIPYEIQATTGDGFVCVYIPSLGRDLFHAYGESEEDALCVLRDSYPDLIAWHREHLGEPPPPDFRDEDSDEARGEFPGLPSIMGAIVDGPGHLQPFSCYDLRFGDCYAVAAGDHISTQFRFSGLPSSAR